MVNRENWKTVNAYLKFEAELHHRQAATITAKTTRLRYLLEWLDETPLTRADKVRPTFAEYMNGLVRADNGRGKNHDAAGRLSDASIGAVLNTAAKFARWARDHVPAMRPPLEWIDTLSPIRRDRPVTHERTAVTLEIVRALLAADWADTRGRRAKAAVALLFLSGMRITAFATMPIKALNLAERSVRQDPTIGVMTKLRKRATTYLLDIPELLEVVTAWDSEVRQHATPDDPWFYRFNHSREKRNLLHSATIAAEIQTLFERAGLPPMSPHKFRHGHATYAMNLSKDVADFKMLSQNLMHANLGITDGIYAILSQDDMRERMAALGKGAQGPAAQPAAVVPDMAALIEETVKRLMQAQADQAAHALPAEPKPRKPRKARGGE